MKNFIITIFSIPIFCFGIYAQYLASSDQKEGNKIHSDSLVVEAKTKKISKSYIGIGYSFVGFTNKIMSIGYPFLDVKSGDFVSELNLFWGMSITRAFAFEIEPSISFSRNYRFEKIDLSSPFTFNKSSYIYDFPVRKSYFAIPLAVNLKLFPFNKSRGFGRLLFIGGASGVIFVKEEYDHRFTNNQNYNGAGDTTRDVGAGITSTSQMDPLFRAMIGFTGGSRLFSFGGEIRYTFISLKTSGEPFRTRMSKDANNIDIVLRIYYKL